MNWNDYEAVWKRQPFPQGAEADLAGLKAGFETKHRKQAATLLVRDWTEMIAGLVVCLAFGAIWRAHGAAAWPIGISLLLVLAVCGVFAGGRVRALRLRMAANTPLLAKVHADLAELRFQLRLLRTIWWWYLGPILAAVLIVHFTLTGLSPAWSPQRDPVISAGFVGFYLFCMGLVWWMNRHAIRTQLEPRIAELEKLRADLAA